MSPKFYNLREAVSFARKKFGERIFIDPFEKEFASITYSDLDNFVNCYAEFLKSCEVPEMEKVAVISGTSTMTALLFVGTLACDRVFVPINAASTKSEVLRYLDQVTPGLIICDPNHLDDCKAWARDNCAQAMEIADGHALYERILSADVPKPFKSKCCTSDVAEIVFTSGSTGEPKGVILSHGALIANANGLIRRYGTGADDHFMVSVPIFHCGGQIFPILCPLLTGATTTVVEPKVALLKFWEIASQHEITWSILITAFLPALLQTESRANAIKGLLVGGSALSADLIARFEAKFTIPVYQIYGMTEVAAVTICEEPERTKRTPGSVGKPLDIAAIRVITPDLNDVEPLVHGEVCIKSGSKYNGYYQNPEATQRRNLGGYVRTGDIGYVDENQNLVILGRMDEMFNVGSENVYPAEIEAVGPELRGIESMIVLPVASEATDNEVVMIYKPDHQSAAIDQGTWDRVFREKLSYFKRPKHKLDIGSFGLVDWIYTGSGKIDRVAMKSKLVEFLQ